MVYSPPSDRKCLLQFVSPLRVARSSRKPCKLVFKPPPVWLGALFGPAESAVSFLVFTRVRSTPKVASHINESREIGQKSIVWWQTSADPSSRAERETPGNPFLPYGLFRNRFRAASGRENETNQLKTGASFFFFLLIHQYGTIWRGKIRVCLYVLSNYKLASRLSKTF